MSGEAPPDELLATVSSEETTCGEFTNEAMRFWQVMPDEHKEMIITNVWCGSCSQGTTIVSFKGRMERGDLVLEGECQGCGGPVARVVEGS